jgi:hypothetical protein
MKDALTIMLTNLISQHAFLAQVAADVSALKTVVSALGPEASAVLEHQVAVERDKYQHIVEDQRLMLEALRLGISQIPN